MAVSGQVTVDRDRDLVERCRAGNAAASDELFHSHKDSVYSVCLGVLSNPEDALDALQECFALVHRNLHRFDGRSRFSTWLYRIAVNASIQLVRKAKARPKTVPLNPNIPDSTHTDVSLTHDPGIAKALACLPPPDRAVLSLFYWQELSLPEIAEVLGCSHGAAKVRLYRARERFKEAYLASSPEAGR